MGGAVGQGGRGVGQGGVVGWEGSREEGAVGRKGQ